MSEEPLSSIIFIKEKDILISAEDSCRLYFWSMRNYQCITVIEKIFCSHKNALYQLDEEKLLIGANFGNIMIFDIKEGTIERYITEKEIRELGVFCCLRIRNKRGIICGYSNDSWMIYDINKRKLKKIKEFNENTMTMDI